MFIETCVKIGELGMQSTDCNNIGNGYWSHTGCPITGYYSHERNFGGIFHFFSFFDRSSYLKTCVSYCE